MSDHENDNGDTERLSLRLPPGLKKEWKTKASDRDFGSIWKYLKYLVENDVKENELPPRTVQTIEKLYAENHLLHEKLGLLIDKIGKLEELLATKTLIQRSLSELEKRKILEFAAAPGRKLSEIAEKIEKDEITTLGILDTLEGMGKIRLETENGLWSTIERK